LHFDGKLFHLFISLLQLAGMTRGREISKSPTAPEKSPAAGSVAFPGLTPRAFTSKLFSYLPGEPASENKSPKTSVLRRLQQLELGKFLAELKTKPSLTKALSRPELQMQPNINSTLFRNIFI